MSSQIPPRLAPVDFSREIPLLLGSPQRAICHVLFPADRDVRPNHVHPVGLIRLGRPISKIQRLEGHKRRERESATRNPMIGKRISLLGLFPFAIHGLAGSKPALPASRLHYLIVITAPPYWIRVDWAGSAQAVG